MQLHISVCVQVHNFNYVICRCSCTNAYYDCVHVLVVKLVRVGKMHRVCLKKKKTSQGSDSHHDDGFEPRDQVLVRLARRVAVVVLVGVPQRELFGISLLDLLIRHSLAHALHTRTSYINA